VGGSAPQNGTVVRNRFLSRHDGGGTKARSIDRLRILTPLRKREFVSTLRVVTPVGARLGIPGEVENAQILSAYNVSLDETNCGAMFCPRKNFMGGGG